MLVTPKSGREWAALPARVREWIEAELQACGPKPSPEAYYKLAEKIRVILNRHNNAEREKLRDPSNIPLNDVSVQELGEKKLHRFYDAVRQVLVEADELESFFGNYTWEFSDDKSISLSDFTQMSHSLLMWKSVLTPIPKSQKKWEQTGRKIALEIQRTMQAAGKKRPLSAEYSASITAVVGSRVISWAFEIKITPVQFAEKMRPQDRKQKPELEKSFQERFPDVMRIRLPE